MSESVNTWSDTSAVEEKNISAFCEAIMEEIQQSLEDGNKVKLDQ